MKHPKDIQLWIQKQRRNGFEVTQIRYKLSELSSGLTWVIHYMGHTENPLRSYGWDTAFVPATRIVVFPVGISGAGKNYLHETRFVNSVMIEPDAIRRICTGSVSDQTRNAEVFDLCHHFLRREMSFGERGIYLSETHLWLQGIRDELEMVLAYGYEPIFVILETASRDSELCRERVREAIRSGEDRSATAEIIGRTGKPLIEEMSEGFIEMIESEEFKDLIRPYHVIRL